MKRDVRNLLAIGLMLAPFIYWKDGDKFRAYEVVVVAIVIVSMGAFAPFRVKREAEWFILPCYGAILVIQQLFIPTGDLWFGFQYFVVMVAAFVPAWVVRAVCWRQVDFAKSWDVAIKLAALIIVANILGSRFLSIGEIHMHIETDSGRYFGFLGDSISPVIVFPLLYFFVQRQYIWAGAIGFAAFLTGGKAAAGMFLIGLCLLVLLPASWRVRLAIIPVFVLIGSVGHPLVNSATEANPGIEYSWNTRLISYEIGWSKFMESPIYGVGIVQSMSGMSETAAKWARAHHVKSYHLITQIHNSFIRALAETGILGCGVLVWLCIVLIRRSLLAIDLVRGEPRSPTRSLVIAASIWTVSFIVINQTVGWFEHIHPQLAWLLLISSIAPAASLACATDRRLPRGSERFTRVEPATELPNAPLESQPGSGMQI